MFSKLKKKKNKSNCDITIKSVPSKKSTQNQNDEIEVLLSFIDFF